MNQYLDAAIKAARAAGALVRGNFGRPIKVNVEEAHDIKLELDVRSQALITDYQGTAWNEECVRIRKARGRARG